MNPADTFAPFALHAGLLIGSVLLVAGLVGTWRRRRARRARAFAAALRLMGTMRDVPPER